jgi:hypothetical protein
VFVREVVVVVEVAVEGEVEDCEGRELRKGDGDEWG